MFKKLLICMCSILFVVGISSYSNAQLSTKALQAIATLVPFADYYNNGTVSSGTVTLDFKKGAYHEVTAGGNFTIAFSNWPKNDKVGRIILKLNDGGVHTITYPSSVTWVGSDIVPTLTDSGFDIIEFTTFNSGTAVSGRWSPGSESLYDHENDSDQHPEYMTPAEFTTTVGEDHDTEAELKALTSKAESLTLETAEVVTFTAGYKHYDVSVNCETAITALTISETGVINDATALITNTSSGADEGNICSFTYAASNLEWPGGSGLTILMLDGEKMLLHFEVDRWKVLVNSTSTQWVAGIASKNPISGDPDVFDTTFASISGNTSNMYGGTYRASGTGTAPLPPVLSGMHFTYVLESADANVIDPDGTGTADTIIMNGLPAAQDENITSSTIGAICYFEYAEADKWMATCHLFTEATPP